MIKKLRVQVEGKTYEVEVEVLENPASNSTSPTYRPATPSTHAPRPAASTPVPSATPAPAPSVAAVAGAIPSPLAGRVVAVQVQVGQKVNKDEQLLTLEAMKMNTFVLADRAGQISAVLVQAGDAVEEGQSLLKID